MNFEDLLPKNCYNNAAQNSINQCPNKLNENFFSAENMENIQFKLVSTFKSQTGVAIERQKSQDLVTIMRSVFINNAKHLPTQIPEQIADLNDKVVETCLPMVARGVEQYLTYVRDASTMYTPQDRGVNSSIKGTKITQNAVGLK